MYDGCHHRDPVLAAWILVGGCFDNGCNHHRNGTASVGTRYLSSIDMAVVGAVSESGILVGIRWISSTMFIASIVMGISPDAV